MTDVKPHMGNLLGISDELPPPPTDFLVVLQDVRDQLVDDDICVHARECRRLGIEDGSDVVIGSEPTLSAAIAAGERERASREITTGVGICDCAEPQTLVLVGIRPDFTWYRENRPIQSGLIHRRVLDSDKLAAAIAEVDVAVPVRSALEKEQ